MNLYIIFIASAALVVGLFTLYAWASLHFAPTVDDSLDVFGGEE